MPTELLLLLLASFHCRCCCCSHAGAQCLLEVWVGPRDVHNGSQRHQQRHPAHCLHLAVAAAAAGFEHGCCCACQVLGSTQRSPACLMLCFEGCAALDLYVLLRHTFNHLMCTSAQHCYVPACVSNSFQAARGEAQQRRHPYLHSHAAHSQRQADQAEWVRALLCAAHILLYLCGAPGVPQGGCLSKSRRCKQMQECPLEWLRWAERRAEGMSKHRQCARMYRCDDACWREV